MAYETKRVKSKYERKELSEDRGRGSYIYLLQTHKQLGGKQL